MAGTGLVGAAAPAAADPVYEITSRWAEDTPTTVSSGDVLNSEWRVNVNDDAAAPSNEPVDDVYLTVTATNGEIVELPDICLTTGVTPASSISEDGTTLVCNVGTVDMGTAAAITVPVVATGETGDLVTLSGEIGGVPAEPLPEIEIVNEFGMDIRWESAVSGVTYGEDYVDASFQWTLSLFEGSDPGPDTVTYTIDVGTANDAAVSVAPDACSAFTGGVASGHPWSGGDHPAEQTTSFVDSCTLTPTATPGVFTLTLSGIDYSALQAPTTDSAGQPLPADRVAIASGSVTFRVAGTDNNSMTLESDAPEYTSPTGGTATDDPANNTSARTWVTGGWSSAWRPEATGYTTPSWWSDQFRVSPGADVESVVSGQWASADPDEVFGQCVVMDTRYVDFESATLLLNWDGEPVPGATLEYYVGGDALLDPDSASYDPNAFECGDDPGGWTTTPPADLTTVGAVRATYPYSSMDGVPRTTLNVGQQIEEDVPVGQDVWQWGAAYIDGTWRHPSRSTDPADRGTGPLTPDARYPFLGNGRDIVRIIGVTPTVSKTVDRSVVSPGVPATYTLTYSANGAGAVQESVDDFELVDTLPVGTVYVAGSAAPEPVVTTDDQGRQVLTWTLDGVPTNTPQPLSYQAVVDASVEPGDVLTNTATSSVAGETSTPATAQVTVTTNGYTQIGKSTDQWFIANPDGDGSDESGSWTVALRSFDPLAQDYTDTIDILPFNGDERGTSFSGSYDVTSVDVPAGATVYYTTADPATLSDDPADASNGGAGDVAGNTVGWSTTFSPDATAVRVIGPELAPGGTFAFTVNIEPDGAEPGDTYVNRAQARAEHTELVMRTSEPLTMGTFYSVSLKKYVQDAEGVWVDANDVVEYPSYQVGDTVPYRVVVTNTGQGTLTDLEVADDLQPELGGFTIDELVPGEENAYVHEYEVVLEAGGPDSVVNTACVSAPQPEDTEDPVAVSCDPAGIEVEGDPTHVKELVSATPIGDGRWEVVYGIEVTNTSEHPTSYSLTDELRFTDQATIVSAEVTGSPEGVELAEPAWDGQGDLTVATAVPLLGSDDDGYAPHTYELTVIAEVPLQLEGAGGDPDPTDCPADSSDAEQGFNNVSELTKSSGEVEPDQACAQVHSIDIDKSVSAGPAPNGDGTWTVTYDVVATNEGAAEGIYEVTDRMTADGDLEVVSGAVVSAPDGVTPEPGWTGLGDEGAEENIIASGVVLPAGGTHTYQVEVVIGLVEGAEGAPVITDCAALGEDGPGGLSNTAEIEHNDLTDDARACVSVGVVIVDKSVGAGPTPNGDGTWTVVYDIVAEHVGEEVAEYDVTDRLHFGEGIEILEAGVVTTPDGVEASAGWTGLGAEDSDPENLVAGGVTMPVGGVHTYQVEVTVQMDEAIDPAALECAPEGSGQPGGLGNSVSLGSNGIVGLDDVCPTVTVIELTKELTEDSPVANGDGTWTITYDVTASNVGPVDGTYDVSDDLAYGAGIEVVSSEILTAPEGVDANMGWTGLGEPGSDENVLATGADIDAGVTHSYQVQVVASLDLDVVTPGDLVCPPPGSGGSGGFANTAELTHNGVVQSDEECVSPPLVDIAKSITGAVTPVEGQDGQYDVTYELVVTNRGPGADDYDLTDTLVPGEGITVVGIRDVSTDVEDSVGINSGFDGVEDTSIVEDQPIAGSDGAAVVHTYAVTVRYAADLSDVVLPDTDECTSGGDAVDGALNNVAEVDWNGIEGSDSECVRPGKPTLDKALVSAEPVGDGRWEVVYDLTVGNVGSEATTYDLDDELLFAEVITVDSVGVTGPDGVSVDDGFDGAADQRIATDVPIVGLDDDDYAPHVYTVTVVAEVPLHFAADAVGADGSGSPACTEPVGSNLVAQGLNNAATLTDESGGQVTDTDCAEVPSIEVTKSVVGEPAVGDGVWTVTYDVVAVNDGAARGVYTLTDRLRFGAGIDVRSATVTKAPKAAEIQESWTGLGDEGSEANVIATDVGLKAGGQHTYTVVVTAIVEESAVDASTWACPEPGSGEPGGFSNVAGIGHNDLADTAEACAEPTPPGSTPPGQTPPGSTPGEPGAQDPGTVNTPIGALPRTGATVVGILVLAVLLTLAGAYGVRVSRRHTTG